MKRTYYLIVTILVIILLFLIIPDKRSEFMHHDFKYDDGYCFSGFFSFSETNGFVLDNDLNIFFIDDSIKKNKGRVLIFNERRLIILSPNGKKIGSYYIK